MGYLFYLLAFLFCVVCVFLILLILIQKGRGGGLSSAFGGAGGNTAFGTKTGDLLTWVTSVVFGVFLLLSMGLIWTIDYVHAEAIKTMPASIGDDTVSGTTDGTGEAGTDSGAAPAGTDTSATDSPATEPDPEAATGTPTGDGESAGGDPPPE